MGQHKIKTIDLSDQEDKDKSKKEKKVDEALEKANEKLAEEKKEASKPKKKKVRSKKYHEARGRVDRTKTYKLTEAVDLVKKTTYVKFHNSVTADIVMNEEKTQVEVAFPHPTGKIRKIEIATDKLIKEVEKGKTNFDILIATPEMMPKLAKLAKILGPKGLMPNPKNGTITKDPSKRKKELEGGKLIIKSEKKAPLIHVVVGKSDHDDKHLIENIEKLINTLNPKKIAKLVLSSSMGPGIKVNLEKFIEKE